MQSRAWKACFGKVATSPCSRSSNLSRCSTDTAAPSAADLGSRVVGVGVGVGQPRATWAAVLAAAVRAAVGGAVGVEAVGADAAAIAAGFLPLARQPRASFFTFTTSTKVGWCLLASSSRLGWCFGFGSAVRAVRGEPHEATPGGWGRGWGTC